MGRLVTAAWVLVHDGDRTRRADDARSPKEVLEGQGLSLSNGRYILDEDQALRMYRETIRWSPPSCVPSPSVTACCSTTPDQAAAMPWRASGRPTRRSQRPGRDREPVPRARRINWPARDKVAWQNLERQIIANDADINRLNDAIRRGEGMRPTRERRDQIEAGALRQIRPRPDRRPGERDEPARGGVSRAQGRSGGHGGDRRARTSKGPGFGSAVGGFRQAAPAVGRRATPSARAGSRPHRRGNSPPGRWGSGCDGRQGRRNLPWPSGWSRRIARQRSTAIGRSSPSIPARRRRKRPGNGSKRWRMLAAERGRSEEPHLLSRLPPLHDGRRVAARGLRA